MEYLLETHGEPVLLFAFGGLIGLIFGAAAYRSEFCLRAATVEVADGHFSKRLSIWLIAILCGGLCGAIRHRNGMAGGQRRASNRKYRQHLWRNHRRF